MNREHIVWPMSQVGDIKRSNLSPPTLARVIVGIWRHNIKTFFRVQALASRIIDFIQS